MKLNETDENIIKNLKAYSSGKVVVYLLLGISGACLITIFINPGALLTAVLYLSGLITGLAIEKFYSRKIYALCLKLYMDFKAK